MSTILANRAQSAYPRSSYPSRTDRQNAHIKKRPTTSMTTHQPYTNVFDEAALRTLEPATLSPPISRRQRPKTSSTITRTSTRSASRKLRSDEIESLLRSLDRDDAFIVQVDCLADYRTLAQTIDLRRTPLDCQLLCALQQRENRIVQRNACRDARFRSLIETLSPSHVPGYDEQDDLNDANHSTVSEYPPSDLTYDYIK
ncbi:unnamed protein product [Rotaria sordida]|uniref:Uncharacterized protein n=1 Tax=Rotaria sordida TaxID=392033 RepID=A0A818XPK1_9BILA|nr:unnamed protein product [Rotaria sordida]CAF1303734.1 unnamed protein product [Rotaria sordida]CAF1412259.1 unnamed protein product [Rotaria sordida]CAF1575925.1 unnamed protein product [Rotaria sordida]CAF3607687.1 unnamed protein product [Rotaria sordida]